MNKILSGLIGITTLVGCGSNNIRQAINDSTKIKDSIAKQKTIDAQMALGQRSDGE